MKRLHFWSNTKNLIRQIVSAWVILFSGTILFVVIALCLNPFFAQKDTVIIVTMLITFPLLLSAHLLLRITDYYINVFFKPVAFFSQLFASTATVIGAVFLHIVEIALNIYVFLVRSFFGASIYPVSKQSHKKSKEKVK